MAALHGPCAAERSQSPAGPWHQGSSCPRAVLQGCRHQVHGERCALCSAAALGPPEKVLVSKLLRPLCSSPSQQGAGSAHEPDHGSWSDAVE